MTDTEKIRQFERQVLDTLYKGKEFYNYSQEIVIPYLLQSWGDVERYRYAFIQKGWSELSASFFLTNMMHGISHCIRWIKSQEAPLHEEIESYRKAHELSMDFILWGVDYHAISQEFITWSRGVKSVELIENEKTIRFLNPENYTYNDVSLQQELYASQLQHEYEGLPHDGLNIQFEEWIKTVDLKNPPIYKSINWHSAKKSQLLPLVLKYMEDVIFPELPSTTDLEGYSLGELRYFFSILHLNFYFVRWIEGIIDSKSGVENSFGSNPIYDKEEKILKFFSSITSLPLTTVTRIINDLTFDDQNFHTSISIQPFIKTVGSTLIILPNLFLFLQPNRLITGAYTKGKKKGVYDRISSMTEKIVLKDLYDELLSQTTWINYKEKTLRVRDKKITPDLIIIDTVSKHILVADYKNIVGPITASEVTYRMKEIEKGIEQLMNYKKLIQSLSTILDSRATISEYTMYLMLISHKPLPIPLPKSSEVMIIDKPSFMRGLKLPINNLLSNFITEIQRVKENHLYQKAALFEDDFIIKDWRIIRQLYKVPQ